MSIWQTLTWEKLPDWIDHRIKGPALPIFRLRDPEKAGGLDERVEIAGAQTRIFRRPDSGVLQLRSSKQWGSSDMAPLFEERLYKLARNEDERNFEPVAEIHSQVIIFDSRSWLPEMNLPVIGPGGRITVAAEADGTTADIVVRRREFTFRSEWRQHRQLLEDIQRRITERASGNRIGNITGAFGYLELSKYERQQWLRPVFLLSLAILVDGDERVSWGDTVVEVATVADEIHATDGLGNLNE